MIIWVMPDSGARTKEDYALLRQLFEKEHPGVELTVRVFTRNVLWRKIFMLKNPAPEEEIPDLVQIPHVQHGAV